MNTKTHALLDETSREAMARNELLSAVSEIRELTDDLRERLISAAAQTYAASNMTPVGSIMGIWYGFQANHLQYLVDEHEAISSRLEWVATSIGGVGPIEHADLQAELRALSASLGPQIGMVVILPRQIRNRIDNAAIHLM